MMTPTPYRVTLWVDGKPTEVHQFSLEYNTKGWYTSTMSINAFHVREATRLHKQHKKGKWDVVGKRCSVRWGVDTLDYFFAQKDLPVFEHATVWDFYKAIGYDYKKKRYDK